MPNTELSEVTQTLAASLDDEIDQLNIRRISKRVKEQIKESATARGLTIPEYITRLSALHRAMLVAGDSDLLNQVGLGKVEV